MLEIILKLYSMYMATGVTSPLPHLFGPPGCGKSSTVELAASLVEKQLHVINVSRISPLELEGVQMPVPHDTEETLRLKLLTATFWTQLQEGDILLLDEFLRGFPEVYNGLLDILTSRTVGGFRLPKVFIIAASNSTVSYDKALEDRLMHLPVTDPRKNKGEKNRLAKRMIEEIGLLPSMDKSAEMQAVLDNEVLPMYEVLDALGKNTASPATIKGRSLRNLIGMAKLREVKSPHLSELIALNNVKAMNEGKVQFVYFISGRDARAHPTYEEKAKKLVGNDRLTELQALNLNLNLQLIELEQIRQEKGTEPDDDDNPDDIFS